MRSESKWSVILNKDQASDKILHEITANKAIAGCDISIEGTHMAVTWTIIDKENTYKIIDTICSTKWRYNLIIVVEAMILLHFVKKYSRKNKEAKDKKYSCIQ